jgi:hypothetical protein
MVPGSTWPSPRARATTATASGAARLRLRSPRPPAHPGALPVRIALASRSASSVTNTASRSCTPDRLNGAPNGRRCRSCPAPSSESMLGPTIRAVVNRGSSTVKAALSRSTAAARSHRVTSQPFSTGTQETGSVSRSRASAGWGSSRSSARVRAAPRGYWPARSVMTSTVPNLVDRGPPAPGPRGGGLTGDRRLVWWCTGGRRAWSSRTLPACPGLGSSLRFACSGGACGTAGPDCTGKSVRRVRTPWCGRYRTVSRVAGSRERCTWYAGPAPGAGAWPGGGT